MCVMYQRVRDGKDDHDTVKMPLKLFKNHDSPSEDVSQNDLNDNRNQKGDIQPCDVIAEHIDETVEKFAYRRFSFYRIFF